MAFQIVAKLFHSHDRFLIYSSCRFGTGAVCFYIRAAKHFGKSLAHLGTVAVLYTNKKDLLGHLGKGKESRTAGLFFVLAATGAAVIATANAAGPTTAGVFLILCVHGFTFYD